MITIPESIKSLLKSDSSRKNFRVHFPNGEREDITNANIVSESVTLTESICSTQQLKIGMCETPSIEFETLGVGYIRGAEIECSLEVICDSTVSGAVYREDIDQYVYPIPYGTFIVDSCKKQADMSHRQIVAYNKIAYKSWEFNDYTKNILSLGMYWYKSKLKISLEGLLKLIVPDMNANFEEMSQSAVHREGLVGEYTRPYGDYTETWQVFARYSVFGYSERGDDNLPIYPSIGHFRITYDPEFINKIAEIKEYLIDLGFDVSNAFMSQKPSVACNRLRYFHPSSPAYTLITPESIQKGVWIQELGNPFYLKEDNTFVFPSLDVSESVDSGTSWQNDGFSHGEISDYRSIVFYGLRLHRIFADDEHTYIDTDVFNTGDYTCHIYNDTDVYSVDMFNSPSNIYFTPTCKKKSVNMKYEEGGTGTVTKPLYKYDFSSLLSLDLQSVFQSYCELQGKFGLITRDGNIKLVSVNEAFNSPDDTINKSDYYTLWYDDFPTKPYGRITASYKDANGDTQNTYYDLVANFVDSEYKIYDISNNYFIKNYTYTEEQVQTILQRMAVNMTNISYMPMNLSMKGRPDLEAGDVVILNSDEQQITGFIMQRTINGIQGLVDELASSDDPDQSSLISLNASLDEDSGILTLYTSQTRR